MKYLKLILYLYKKRVRMASFSQFCWKRLWLSPMWSWNLFPSSAIWAIHLVREEVWRRQQEPEWDVLGPSSRSYLNSWQLDRGASYRIKGKIHKACVQSVLTYGTETWAMKKANLQSLKRTERMMVRWRCGVSLKDRKRSVDLYSLLGVEIVAEVVRRGRLRWFGHVERIRVEMIGCRPQWRRQPKKSGGSEQFFLLVSSKKLQYTRMGHPPPPYI